jgi:hypothetical protein
MGKRNLIILDSGFTITFTHELMASAVFHQERWDPASVGTGWLGNASIFFAPNEPIKYLAQEPALCGPKWEPPKPIRWDTTTAFDLWLRWYEKNK